MKFYKVMATFYYCTIVNSGSWRISWSWNLSYLHHISLFPYCMPLYSKQFVLNTIFSLFWCYLKMTESKHSNRWTCSALPVIGLTPTNSKWNTDPYIHLANDQEHTCNFNACYFYNKLIRRCIILTQILGKDFFQERNNNKRVW